MNVSVSNTPPAEGVSQPAYPSAPAAWGAVAILFSLSLVSMLDRNLVSLLVSEIKADLKISEVEMGTLMGAAYALFYAIGALPIGWAMDRYNRPKVIWCGVTLWSLGTIGCGFAHSFWTMFAARAVVGSGEATMVPATYSLLPDLFPRHRLALAMSVYSMSSKVGAGVSLALGGLLTALILPAGAYALPLLGTMKGWQLIFIIAGLPGFALAAAIFLVRDRHRGRDRATPSANYRDYGRFVWANRRFIISHHCAIIPLVTLIFGLYAWLPSFYQRHHHMSTAALGVGLGLALSVGPVIALPVHGWIADRWYKRGRRDAHLRYLIATLLLASPFGAAAFVVPSPYVSFGLIGMFFMIASGYLSLPTVVLQLVLPQDLRGKAAAVVVMLSGLIAAGAGPLLVAALSERLGGPDQVGWSLLICTAVAIPLTAFLYTFALIPLRTMLERNDARRA